MPGIRYSAPAQSVQSGTDDHLPDGCQDQSDKKLRSIHVHLLC